MASTATKKKRKDMTSEQVVVNGFTVIPIRISQQSSAGHYLFVKEHSTRESSEAKPKDRTLFVINVPPYCNKESLKLLFKDCGNVKAVHIHKNPTSSTVPEQSSMYFDEVETVKGFKVAYVVFDSPKGVENAKQIPFGQALIVPEKSILTGKKKWCRDYSNGLNIDTEKMQEEITTWLQDYDTTAQKEEEAAKQQAGVPDEEGWVTVTKHSRNKPTPRTDLQEKKVLAKEKDKQKNKELINFYSFQMRESKREHIAQLRQKFEEDKNRIQLMKSARKFRPY